MSARFSTLRLLADDMTGALDSAAAFVRLFGPLDVGTGVGGGNAPVLDMRTRELPRNEAAARVATLGAHLAPAAGRLSFFKLDSLLRGHAGAELAALLGCLTFDFVIIAPAMPFQGRITRAGRQLIRENGVWQETGEDIAKTLQEAGFAVCHAGAGEHLRPGITLLDAADEAELGAITAAGLGVEGSVLWVGSGGLAGSLANNLANNLTCTLAVALSAPVLGLIGSHHPVMLAQLGRVPAQGIEINDAGESAISTITARMAETGAAFVSCALPMGLSRDDARCRIETLFADLVTQLPPPGLLFVSGGETLRALLAALDATGLTVFSEIEPGAPLSRITGGRWNGVTVLSKSGAFGTPDFLKSLLVPFQNNRKAALS